MTGRGPAGRPPLSVLDLSPVSAGSAQAQALHETLALARAAERWGYRRYWLAEHHNLAGLASSAPEVMVGAVAAATRTMRVGAGGIMLPNHAPLRVAEVFRVLEALHPGRIDLGIGRAPGTDAAAAAMLRRGDGRAGDFPGQMQELLALAGGGFAADDPRRTVRAEPAGVPLPPVWILGSSEHGAHAAAALGVGLAFARHFNPRNAARIAQEYRDAFRPPPGGGEPRLILAVSVVCAETEVRATQLVGSGALALLRMRRGRSGPLPTPEEAAAHAYTEHEADQVRRYMRAQVVGDPEGVWEQLDGLTAETGADELMVMTQVHDHAERLRSYELVAAGRDLGVHGAGAPAPRTPRGHRPGWWPASRHPPPGDA